MTSPLDLRLYAIIDVGPDGLSVGLELVERAIAGGVTLLQARGKRCTPHRLWQSTRELVRFARSRRVPVLVNDRPDLAAAAGARGVHLGQGDLPAEVARRLWPALCVGVSVHSPGELQAALHAGADYVAAGALYPTGSKADATPLDHAQFRSLAAVASRPLVGIGGILPENAADVIRLGAAGVAVISGLWGAGDPGAAAARYRSAMDASADP